MTYNPKDLWFDLYGKLYYLPKIDVLSQLQLDPDSLASSLKEEGGVHLGPSAFAGLKITVPVPPSPRDAEINIRTKKRFPLGTHTDPETGEPLRRIPSVSQVRPVRNQVIYTKPEEGYIYYVDKNGRINVKALQRLSSLVDHPRMILNILDIKIDCKSTYTPLAGNKVRWDPSLLESRFFVDPKDSSEEASALRKKLRSVTSTRLDTPTGIPLFMYSRNSDFREYVNSRIRYFERNIKAGSKSVDKRGGALDEEFARLLAAQIFSDKYSVIRKEQGELDSNSSVVDPDTAPEVPNLSPSTKFLPHQSYALAFLRDKKSAMVDADPGAGKTLMIIADILDKMNRDLVHRPCIVMPNALLSDQKKELEEWTRGTINFIVINTDTSKRMDPELGINDKTGLPRTTGGDKNRGRQALADLIKSSPKNTILMTSYEWLRGGRDDKVERESGTVYRNPRWLKEVAGVDMLVLDESHAVRINSSGKASGRAEAILQLAPLVPYKRCFSGTVAPSSPEDIYLQGSFLDPSIFGNHEEFLDRYALSVNKTTKRVEEFKPGAIKEIKEILAKRVGLSIRRSAWLDRLPKLDVNYHKVSLTAAQHVVYQKILDRILREELGELDPGTVGRELQLHMEKLHSADSSARDQISQWKKPSVVSLPHFDPTSGTFVDIDFDQDMDSSDDEDESSSSSTSTDRFDVSDSTKLEVYRQAKKRVTELWQKYEALGDAEDAPDAFDSAPFIAKFVAIDKFLNSPTSDDFGKYFLVDQEDRNSPKLRKIDEILSSHFSDPTNGKVIIFTHYKDVARHVADNIQMSGSAIYYDAQHKDALSKFKKDPNIKILVAVERSIQEGQNLQMANRIIRLDLPWNPGNYSQALARSYRLPSKDPNAPRYSSVYVDLIFVEGTAELTKFARMVSKMHAVQQLVSGFTSQKSFRLVGMNQHNVENLNTFALIKAYQDAYADMRRQEIDEARLAPNIYGTEMRSLATGNEMEGTEKIETPVVESDRERGPWTTDPNRMTRGVINPEVMFFNGAYWLRIESIENMSFPLQGMTVRDLDGQFVKTFNNPRSATTILQDLRQKGLSVLNIRDIQSKVMGRQPVDPAYPQSVITYAKTRTGAVKVATVLPKFSRGSDDLKQALAFNPSQEQLRAARRALLRSGKSPASLKDIHVLFAAKVLGLYRLDPSTVDPRSFYISTQRPTFFADSRKILQDQLSSVVESPTSPFQEEGGPGSASDAAPPEESSLIPGVTAPGIPSEGIPVTLDVIIAGRIRAGKLISSPALALFDHSQFVVPTMKDRVISILKSSGFLHVNPSRLIFLGETLPQVRKSLKKFSQVIYWWYTLGNPEEYIQTLRAVGFTDEQIEKIFPRHQLTAMIRMAQLIRQYPEFEALTAEIFSA